MRVEAGREVGDDDATFGLPPTEVILTMHSESYSHGRNGRMTVSTRVGPRRLEFLDEKCEERGESRAAFLRYLIRLYEHSDRGNLRCEYCSNHVDLSDDG
jgi:hypothetical protein